MCAEPGREPSPLAEIFGEDNDFVIHANSSEGWGEGVRDLIACQRSRTVINNGYSRWKPRGVQYRTETPRKGRWVFISAGYDAGDLVAGKNFVHSFAAPDWRSKQRQ